MESAGTNCVVIVPCLSTDGQLTERTPVIMTGVHQEHFNG